MAKRASSKAGWLKSPFFWAVAIRLAFAALVPRHMQGDALDYEQIATNLSLGRGFGRCFFEPFNLTAQRPPIYPLVLGFLYFLGAPHDSTPILLNLGCDLVSMYLIRLWAEEMKLSWARFTPWVIALCPLLVTYGMYPTTENLSIAVFFAALWLLYKKMPVASGLVWGVLSLCRSYYLLFPIAMWMFPPSKDLKRKQLAVIIAMSFVAPSIWMVRNYHSLHRVAFTQTSMANWQMYQGLCIANFDWWRADHFGHMMSTPVTRKVIEGHCRSEEEIASLDMELEGMVKQCVFERPAETLRNIVAKGVMLFVNWGLFMPYNRVPFLIQQVVNVAVFYFWWRVWGILWPRRRRLPKPVADTAQFSVLNILYIVAVTIPFAVDARYLLGPFLTILIACFEIVRTPKAFVLPSLRRES